MLLTHWIIVTSININYINISEVAEIVLVAARLGKFQQLLKTQVY